MIAHLRGRLLSKSPNQTTVECAGVGYDVIISVSTFSALPAEGAEASLHIHTHVREDARRSSDRTRSNPLQPPR